MGSVGKSPANSAYHLHFLGRAERPTEGVRWEYATVLSWYAEGKHHSWSGAAPAVADISDEMVRRGNCTVDSRWGTVKKARTKRVKVYFSCGLTLGCHLLQNAGHCGE